MTRETCEAWKRPGWRLLVFHSAMTHLSAALVISALIAGVYRRRVYFMFASCAAGMLMLAAAWREYCRWCDGKPLNRRTEAVPYSLRREKARVRRRPAFLMDSRDFDDDLTPDTMAAEEDFSDADCFRARVAARALAGALMLAVSVIL